MATQWTLDGLVEHFDFVHHKMLDHKFSWVLGAGASYSSGIPLGNQLVDRWLKKMHLREDSTKTSLEKWATADRLGIPGFKYEDRARFYPGIYERCFREYPEEGYAYLESVMSEKDPSPGYSILAASLAQDPPRHNVVVTTNFDNLVADALSIYTDTFPFVAGHESLTSFVRVAMRRPLICKIHRDLLLGPQNDSRSLRRLHDAWGMALRSLFQHYTPLFIGYGGNDDTLMDLLESLRPDDIKGELIWCYYEESVPSDRITNLVTDLNGILVPVPDFDLLMVLLGEKMGIALMDEQIEVRAEKRTERYRNRIQKLDTVKYPSVTKALAATLERSGGWWAWNQKANLENDSSRKEVVFRQGLQHYPKSSALHNNFGVFVWEVLSNKDEAEKSFRKAIELDPKNVNAAANYVEFLLHDDRLDDAAAALKKAKAIVSDESRDFSLVLGWLEALLRAMKKEDIENTVDMIRSMLAEGLRRRSWSMDSLIEFMKKKVSRANSKVLITLASEIRSETKNETYQLSGKPPDVNQSRSSKRSAVKRSKRAPHSKRLSHAKSKKSRNPTA